jgi:hypothetical protein
LFDVDRYGAILYIVMVVVVAFGKGFVIPGVVDLIVIFKNDAVFYLVHIAELTTPLNLQSVF